MKAPKQKWKENKKTGFVKRWDKGTDEVHIQKIPQISAKKDAKRYFVIGSRSVGGFFSIPDGKGFKKKTEAIKKAKRWMKSN